MVKANSDSFLSRLNFSSSETRRFEGSVSLAIEISLVDSTLCAELKLTNVVL